MNYYEPKNIELTTRRTNKTVKYIIFYNGETTNNLENDKITFILKDVDIPFGIEQFNGTQICNISINTERNNELYNAISNIKILEKWAEELKSSNVDFEDKKFSCSIQKKILRTQSKNVVIIKKNKDVDVSIKYMDKLSKGSEDVKKIGKNIDVLIELESIWTHQSEYKFIWILKKIFIN